MGLDDTGHLIFICTYTSHIVHWCIIVLLMVYMHISDIFYTNLYNNSPTTAPINSAKIRSPACGIDNIRLATLTNTIVGLNIAVPLDKYIISPVITPIAKKCFVANTTNINTAVDKISIMA